MNKQCQGVFHRITARTCFFILLFFSAGRNGNSQINDSLISVLQDEIIISGLKYSALNTWSAYRDSVNASDKFSQNFDILLNRQPGVVSYNSENPAQDIRVSVRGFGARAAFGIRGIKVYFDGIPLTSPDGTTQLDELSLFTLHQTELIRSNFSARLGNAGGGALSFKTEPYFSGLTSRLRVNNTGGYDAGLTWGYEDTRVSNLFTLNHHVFEGQREHAKGRNTVVYNKTRWFVNDSWMLESFLNLYHSPRGQDPGSLTASAFQIKPLSANPSNVEFNAGEEVSGINIALKSSNQWNKNHALYTTVFGKQRDFTGRLPFRNGGIVELRRHFYGFHSTYEYTRSANETFSLGTGTENQSDGRKRFANNQGEKGNSDLDQNESVQNIFIFQQWQKEYRSWGLHQLTRFDYFRFAVLDNAKADGLQNGNNEFFNIQAAAGVFYLPVKQWKSYINIGTGFETPTLNEYSNNPTNTGGFNQDLTPERSLQVEWGNTLDLRKNLRFSSSFYWIDLQNMITGYEIDSFPGRTFYRNSSRARRAGIETMVSWDVSRHFTVNMQYFFAQYTFLRHTVNGIDNAGNFIPLTPRQRWTVQINHAIKNMLQYNLQWTYQSSVFVNDENTVRVKPQSNLQCTITTGPKLFKNGQFGISFYNLFNLSTYSNIRANAAGGRYYEAASPIGGALFFQYRFQKQK